MVDMICIWGYGGCNPLEGVGCFIFCYVRSQSTEMILNLVQLCYHINQHIHSFVFPEA